jgi:hypothetical protein
MTDRKELVQALVRYELPIEPVLERLATFGFDSTPLVTLRAKDVVAMLSRYLEGELTAEQVTDWADQLEVRDDVEAEAPYRDQIKEWIFQLANPNLTEGVTIELAAGSAQKSSRYWIVPYNSRQERTVRALRARSAAQSPSR